MTTQKQRVLNALRAAGSAGIDQTQFEPPVVIDGGTPIMRLAARIDELKAEGFAISTPGRRHKCSVYALQAEPSRPVVKAAPQRLVFGFARRYCCRRCLGTVRSETEACGDSYAVLCPPEQGVTGCLSIREQEVAHAA